VSRFPIAADDASFHWRHLPSLCALFAAFRGEGEELRVVGGAVRNSLLGLDVGDIDCATTAEPEKSMEIGKAAGFKAIPTGFDHGTVTLVMDGHAFEVTSLRTDVVTDGRHARVAYGKDWAEDAARRDFTMNALYLDVDGCIFDFLGSGIADAKARYVRFIGDAHARIEEDYLRILRFFRFFAQYGHDFKEEDYQACIALQAGLAQLSAERIGAEMVKILQAPYAAVALLRLYEGGMLAGLCGTAPILRRFERLLVVEASFERVPSLANRLVALCGHSREAIELLARRWRLPNHLRDQAIRRVKLLPLLEERSCDLSLPWLKELAYHHGKEVVTDGLLLQTGKGMDDHLAGLIAGLDAWQVPDFELKGKDLIALGIPAGPELGRILAELETRWIASGFSLKREELLASLSPPSS
jgi:poly(A) polymerase